MYNVVADFGWGFPPPQKRASGETLICQNTLTKNKHNSFLGKTLKNYYLISDNISPYIGNFTNYSLESYLGGPNHNSLCRGLKPGKNLLRPVLFPPFFDENGVMQWLTLKPNFTIAEFTGFNNGSVPRIPEKAERWSWSGKSKLLNNRTEI